MTGEVKRYEMEEWRPAFDFEDSYEISSLGRVRSMDRTDSGGNQRAGGLLDPYAKGRGYLVVSLWFANVKAERYVHRLVAKAFHPNPSSLPQVNHIDGNKKNNAANNLEWVTVSQNQSHSRRVLGNGQRPVYCISCSDGSRTDFPSLQHAVEAGFIRANIQHCIRGDRKSHRGRLWFDAAIDEAMRGGDGRG